MQLSFNYRRKRMSNSSTQSLNLDNSQTSRRNVQKFGAFLSLACAIHCIATPLLIGLLPFAGLGFLENPLVELLMVGTGFIIGFVTILRSPHPKRIPLFLMVFGSIVVAVAFTVAPEALEHVLIPIGAGMAALAQIINLRNGRACENPNHNH